MTTNNIPERVTTETINLVSDKIALAFNAISEKIGVAADKIWPYLVKQQAIIGYSHIIIVLILLAVIITNIHYIRKFSKIEENQLEDEGLLFAWKLISIIGIIFFIVFAPLDLTDTIGRIFNPEYYAIKEILMYIK